MKKHLEKLSYPEKYKEMVLRGISLKVDDLNKITDE